MIIAHFCNYYETKLFAELFEKLSYEKKIQQHVFFPYYKKLNQPPPASRGFSLYVKKSVPNIFRHFFIFRALWTYLIFSRDLLKINFDVIHCHSFFNDGILGLFCKWRFKKKLVCSFRNADLQMLKKKIWLYPFFLLIKSQADQIIFISNTMKSKLPALNGIVIPNGVDELFFQDQQIKKINLRSKLKIIFIGRLIKRKRVDIVLNYYIRNQDKLELTIIGDCEPTSTWGNRQLRKIQKNKQIIYYSSLSKNEVKKELDKNQIFVMTSLNETFGIVYIEAISRGLPIVYTKGTGVYKMFSKAVGVCVHNPTHKSLSLAIDNILSDYENISRNCLKESKKFRWPNLIGSYHKLYQDLVKK